MRWPLVVIWALAVSSSSSARACPADRYFVEVLPYDGCLPPYPTLYVTSLLTPEITVFSNGKRVAFERVPLVWPLLDDAGDREGQWEGTMGIHVELDDGPLDVAAAVDGRRPVVIQHYEVSARCRPRAVGLFTDGSAAAVHRRTARGPMLALFVACCVLLDLNQRRTCAGRS